MEVRRRSALHNSRDSRGVGGLFSLRRRRLLCSAKRADPLVKTELLARLTIRPIVSRCHSHAGWSRGTFLAESQLARARPSAFNGGDKQPTGIRWASQRMHLEKPFLQASWARIPDSGVPVKAAAGGGHPRTPLVLRLPECGPISSKAVHERQFTGVRPMTSAGFRPGLHLLEAPPEA